MIEQTESTNAADEEAAPAAELTAEDRQLARVIITIAAALDEDGKPEKKLNEAAAAVVKLEGKAMAAYHKAVERAQRNAEARAKAKAEGRTTGPGVSVSPPRRGPLGY